MISDLMMSSARMIRLIVITVLISDVLLTACSAQSSANFQSVSGDFGRSWISSFMDQNPKPAENNSGSLWGWGSAPKGSKIVNGELVANTIHNQTWDESYHNWLGDTYVDPITGNTINSYVDPSTGVPVYYYIDPKTEKPVYVDVDPVTGEPAFASISPFGTSTAGSNGPSLPKIFTTSNPWT